MCLSLFFRCVKKNTHLERKLSVMFIFWLRTKLKIDIFSFHWNFDFSCSSFFFLKKLTWKKTTQFVSRPKKAGAGWRKKRRSISTLVRLKNSSSDWKLNFYLSKRASLAQRISASFELENSLQTCFAFSHVLRMRAHLRGEARNEHTKQKWIRNKVIILEALNK